MRRQSVERGERFGRLQAIEEVFTRPRQRCFRLLCDCGNEITAQLAHLKAGRTTSCGCLRRERLQQRERTKKARKPRPVPHRTFPKHGHAKGLGSLEYRAWRNMIQRCHNPKRACYKYYGGRGISVCSEWRTDFTAFLAHIGPKPDGGMSLDRIDNDGNYEPGNVRWADSRTQADNKRQPNGRRAPRLS